MFLTHQKIQFNSIQSETTSLSFFTTAGATNLILDEHVGKVMLLYCYLVDILGHPHTALSPKQDRPVTSHQQDQHILCFGAGLSWFFQQGQN